MYRHKDGTETLYEDPSQVRHERHAENLAARIARDPGVVWVEVEDNSGRFKARASREHDGVVHESLESTRRTVKRKRTQSRRRRAKQVSVWIIVGVLFLLVLTKLLLSRP